MRTSYQSSRPPKSPSSHDLCSDTNLKKAQDVWIAPIRFPAAKEKHDLDVFVCLCVYSVKPVQLSWPLGPGYGVLKHTSQAVEGKYQHSVALADVPGEPAHHGFHRSWEFKHHI